MTSYVTVARRDGTLRRTLGAAVVLAVLFRFALGESWTYTAVVVGAASAAGLVSDYVDYRGTPAAVRHLSFGAVLVAVAGGWLVLDTGLAPLAVVGLTAGLWLVLDGWTARRTGHPDATESPGEELDDRFEDEGFVSNVRTFRELGEVGRAIDRGAHTPADVAAELDRSVESVERDLDDLEAAGAVERIEPEPTDGDRDDDNGYDDDDDNEDNDDGDQNRERSERYRRADQEWSVASWPRRLAARLTRPVRLLVAG